MGNRFRSRAVAASMGLMLVSGLVALGPVAVAAEGASNTSAAATTAQDVRDVDWYNATFTVSEVGGCPPATVTFTDGAGETEDRVYRFAPGAEIVYGDVIGSGRESALLILQCGPRNSEYSTAVVGVDVSEDGVISGLGTVGNKDSWEIVPVDVAIWHGDVAVRFEDFGTGQFTNEYYRFSPREGFVRI
ncbi:MULTISPECIES: hypothetical protein [Actinoalloteichus]|uniref:Uncharacterized protein n=1 Tax=Actinoalloteichus fjordicus TaxID=1612552 RepID=A0AAC9PV55_9PSEU|nr:MULTISPECIES: hypothetical protein [Actinoalloteichus]APU17735.1 hypothetical protein UA74_28680 [Actinoalloteichus fjordicus]APU23813.1 hypothetical protein UA75_29210 [Actinoalloteichus sp. GBA129-24]